MIRLKHAPIGLAVLGLVGCADSPSPPPPPAHDFAGHHRGGPPGGGGGGGGGQASLFISPAGKPFRAGPGEPYPVAKWFAEADKNSDGKVDLAEFQADAEAFFHQLDTNDDGMVAGPEVTFYETKLVPEIVGGRDGEEEGALETGPQFLLAQFGGGGGGMGGGGMGGMGGGMGGGGRGGGRHGGGGQSGGARPDGPPVTSGRGAAPYGLLGEPEPVTAADADFNSLITLREFRDAATRRFALLDTAGIGYLTLATLPKTPAQAGGGGRRGRRSATPA